MKTKMILLTALVLAGTNSFSSAFDVRAKLGLLKLGIQKGARFSKAAVEAGVAGYASFLAATEICPPLFQSTKKGIEKCSISAGRASEIAGYTCLLSGLGLLIYKMSSACLRDLKKL